MSDRIKIPVGKFADDEELKRKREKLKAQLLAGQSIPISPTGGQENDFIPRVCFPAEIEQIKATGILYGDDKMYKTYRVTSNFEHSNKIGFIFKNKPTQFLPVGVTGYYENGVLQFVDAKGNMLEKRPFPLWESWLNGKIEIEYTGRENYTGAGITIPTGSGYFGAYVHFPAEIEQVQSTGILYGDKVYGCYRVTSNSDYYNEIGVIFREKPAQLLPIGITGYYENGVLQFVDSKGRIYKKISYPLWESWLNGKIEIKIKYI